MKTSPHAWYGWNKDRLDSRDRLYAVRRQIAARLPSSATIPAEILPDVWNQGKLGSCTAHGVLLCDQVAARKQHGDDANLSRLFLYYLERDMEGTIASDSGAQIRDGIKALNVTGCCHEARWPYDISAYADKPSPACYKEAGDHQSLEYFRIADGDLQAMKQCLADGWPFVFGFTVFEQFESAECAKTGVVKLPGKKEMILGAVGGHCVAAIGYDDAKYAALCRNSWGADWGLSGNFWIPYDYIGSKFLASDIWTIRRTES